MNTDIRKYIKNNFSKTNNEELKESIVGNINNEEELALPGLGVFFEIIWNESNSSFKNEIINILEKNLNNPNL